MHQELSDQRRCYQIIERAGSVRSRLNQENQQQEKEQHIFRAFSIQQPNSLFDRIPKCQQYWKVINLTSNKLKKMSPSCLIQEKHSKLNNRAKTMNLEDTQNNNSKIRLFSRNTQKSQNRAICVILLTTVFFDHQRFSAESILEYFQINTSRSIHQLMHYNAVCRFTFLRFQQKL